MLGERLAMVLLAPGAPKVCVDPFVEAWSKHDLGADAPRHPLAEVRLDQAADMHGERNGSALLTVTNIALTSS